MIPIFNRLTLNEWVLIIFVYTEKTLSFVISSMLSIIPFSFFLGLLGKDNKIKENQLDSSIDKRQNFKKFLSSDVSTSLSEKLYMCNSVRDMLLAIDPNINMETHVVKTQDNYLLQLHRIPYDKNLQKKGVEYKGPVYLQHGLLMCSNIWLCHSNDPINNNLPLYLNSLGYDVWMGNNRGNRYSNKHLNFERTSTKFWDFSLDELAMYDIPDSLNYILETLDIETKYQINDAFVSSFRSKNQQISIVGFSQGSAQIFASLSLSPELNSKINSFVALSPALTPPGLFNRFVDNIIKLQPKLLFLFFGKKILLPTANTLWQRILPVNLFNTAIKLSTLFLFNWKNENIISSQSVAFKNLYSPTSVKCIVHWFQILKTQKFQMYVSSNDLNQNDKSIFEPIPFPTKSNIKVPLLLIYGDNDSLVDIETLKYNLPENSTFEIPVKNHEHLDIIWGDDVNKLVYQNVANFLNFWKNNNELESNKITTNLISCAQHAGVDSIDESILQPIEMLSRSSGIDDSKSHDDSDTEFNFREELFKY